MKWNDEKIALRTRFGANIFRMLYWLDFSFAVLWVYLHPAIQTEGHGFDFC